MKRSFGFGLGLDLRQPFLNFAFMKTKQKKPQDEASSAGTEMQESIKGCFLQNTGDAWEDLITSVTHTMAFA